MTSHRILSYLCLAAGTLGLLSAPSRAAEPQMWTIEGANELLAGEAAGITIDSEGQLGVGPMVRRMPPLDSPFVWAVARNTQGDVFAGTGNDGKVFALRGDAISTVFDAPESQASALAVDDRGRIYVGTSPDGKVYVIEPNGASRELCDPEDRYIWALRADPSDGLWITTGGTVGRVLKVDAQGQIRVVFTSQESHLTSLVVDRKGQAFVGSAPGGVIFQIRESDEPGAVRAVHDSAYAEVKALALRDGALYAAVVQESSQQRQETTRAAAPAAAGSAAQTGQPEVTVSESFSVTVVASSVGQAVAQAPTTATADKGAVIRLDLATGDAETIWSSTDEMPHDLIIDGTRILVGTGDHGRVLEIRDDLGWRVIAQVVGEQITGLTQDGKGGLVVAASNPGALLRLDGGQRDSGTFTTQVKDAGAPARWGRPHLTLRAGALGTTQVHMRVGNTEQPDDTWSDWTLVLDGEQPQALPQPATRYAQARVTIATTTTAGTPAVVRSLRVPYLQRNQRPRVTSINVHPAGEIFQKQPGVVIGEPEILGLPTSGSGSQQAAQAPPGMTLMAMARRTTQRGLQTFTWNAEDPNQDELSYDVHYRPVEGNTFRPLREGLVDPIFAWDTTAVPDGRYVIRVVASDARGNTPDEARSGEMESGIVSVDNAPPAVSLTVAAGRPTIRCVAHDEHSLVARVDYALNSGPWQRVRPNDGIEDSNEELYEFEPTLPAEGPITILVRATDELGNTNAERLTLR